ncbi:protein of unknown function [Methylotuvimicrobium alcaliphilum 20Z]|uniref:Uncharacterized protein n=1 Tax=Methylotuvimicrobium alcaliphilum (strain DSM 19304 / NCIMB 14124 / VKM B-2133 / 20Z) TaxID=1091494 RepID=G4SZM6_META2|nr:protein of unknown function [Methylotuvimicrobium alcaliphilum 20Z]
MATRRQSKPVAALDVLAAETIAWGRMMYWRFQFRLIYCVSLKYYAMPK